MTQHLRIRFSPSYKLAAVTMLMVTVLQQVAFGQKGDRADVIIYGGTSAAIAAAVQVERMGKSVIVIEPTGRIGGLTTGGLGQTDIGNKAAIGGISREFYQRIRKHYNQDANWNWQRRSEYRSGGQSRTNDSEETMWTFEPSAALQVMQDFVREESIPVVYHERLDRSGQGVRKQNGRILSIRMESGRTFFGRVFLDTSYEGDLLAEAGVSFSVGRETNAEYDETLNGVQTRRATHHQFVAGVDPYVVPGDKNSGLLPGIDPAGPGSEGGVDKRVQAYCFRMCLTDHPDNRIPFKKPEDYDEREYELLFRNFAAGAKRIPWSKGDMPNRKTDVNNNRGFSTDYIGQNYDYPNGSYAEREAIVDRHRRYQQGLMWTLANHKRVPEFVRKEISRWGTCRDEFEREDGWQQQIYVREARRMIGAYVMTQHNCQGRAEAAAPIGLAAYTMDSHNVQRHLTADGFVRNEGDVQVGGFSPYPIDYSSLVPKANECSNLLVPVCLSATHIAFGSIRMEPVFMVLGQTAATAAVHAIDQNCRVQDVNYEQLRARLLADKQVLKWTGPKRVAQPGVLLKSLRGIVADDESAVRSGFDSTSTSVGPYVELGYRHDGDAAKGEQQAEFSFKIPAAGTYEIRMAWSAFSNRATNVPVSILQNERTESFKVNQRKKPAHPPFGIVGRIKLQAGPAILRVSNAQTDGHVILDAVQVMAVK